ncbi:MAG: hypothetical protein DRP42_01970 [Tenericutes bacterium]|nr:MAG: hypothetical protein DRP42_01970 [Mycoplasmatota bacterium]
MKILTSVINKLIDKQMTTEELTSAFLLLGYEVESVIKANQIEGVKFGKTISCSKHPNADKLSLCEVETEGQTYQVICGGKNVASDQVIVHALPGSKVNGFELQMKELRGIESAGMILSITEVGGFSKDLLSIEEQNNIIVMDSSVDLTNDVVSTLGFEGDVIEIDILPDRKYAESYMMIARELSALHGETLKANSTVDTKYMNSILVFNGIELKDEQSNSSEFKTIIGIDKEQTPKTTVSYNDDFAVKYIGNDIDLNDAKIKLGLLGFDFSDDSVSFPE